MSPLESIFAKPMSSREGKEQIERIKHWVRAQFAVDEETSIVVRQVECRALTCPGIETAVAILEYRCIRRIKILKPILEVKESDISETVASGKIFIQTYPPPQD